MDSRKRIHISRKYWFLLKFLFYRIFNEWKKTYNIRFQYEVRTNIRTTMFQLVYYLVSKRDTDVNLWPIPRAGCILQNFDASY